MAENEELLAGILDHYPSGKSAARSTRTTLYNSYKLANLSSYLDQHLEPGRGNLPAVMASLPMQNYRHREGDIGKHRWPLTMNVM